MIYSCSYMHITMFEIAAIVKPYNYIVHTNDVTTKHMFSDMIGWLVEWQLKVAANGRAIELQKFLKKLNILICRLWNVIIDNYYVAISL